MSHDKMAAGFRDSEKIGLGNDTDFTVPHRTPPPVPHSPTSPPTATYSTFPSIPQSPPIGQAFTADGRVAHLPGYRNPHAPASSSQRPQQQQEQPPQVQSQSQPQLARVRTASIGNSGETAASPQHSHQQQQSQSQSQQQQGGRKRGGSFSFLKRSASNSSTTSKHSEPAVYRADSDAPPLPKTRIAQATAEAAARREQNKLRKASSDTERKSSFTMLRKSSKLKKEAQAEAERQAAAVPRQPPHLPSLPFVTDEARPDSVAIFNNAYTHSNAPPTGPPRTTANFSRPNNAMAPSSNINSSSSPAYATRSGTGSSSPPARANGEYVVDPTSDRTESMTNRGRYSYASSVGQANVNSPRRVRRRKDPTPFK